MYTSITPQEQCGVGWHCFLGVTFVHGSSIYIMYSVQELMFNNHWNEIISWSGKSKWKCNAEVIWKWHTEKELITHGTNNNGVEYINLHMSLIKQSSKSTKKLQPEKPHYQTHLHSCLRPLLAGEWYDIPMYQATTPMGKHSAIIGCCTPYRSI